MFNHTAFKDRPTYAEISLPNLRHNISVIRDIVNKTKILGVVKANAYGHGIVEISKEFEKLKLDYLGVAYIEEAVYLRENDIKLPILVLGGINNNQISLFLKHDIDISGSSIEKLEHISTEAKKLGKIAKVHLKIDTGMGRIGVQWNRKEEFLKKAYNLPNLDIVGIYSHFADSVTDMEYTQKQLSRFKQVLEYIEKEYTRPKIVHMGNSGVVTNNISEAFFDMVRPGLVMYGYSYTSSAQKLLKPVMSLKTEVSYFKVLEKNMDIGYDRTYTTKEQTRIITLPIGYGDGYPRTLSNEGFVYLRGKKYPIVGKVCMDQTMVNISQNGEAYVGDTVELWGENISLWDVVEISGKIPWELLCNIGERVPRKYLN